MRRTVITAVVMLTAAALSAAAARPVRPTPAPPPDAPPAAPATRALDDATIVAIFDGANTADIETGRLAAERGHAKQVRDFGAMLARDHQQVRQQGRDLARKLGVTPTPPTPDQGAKDHAAAMTRLRALHGAAFDRAFLANEIAFHQAVIDAVRSTLLPAIKNAEVRDLVVKVAPAFEAHRGAAQHLQQQLAGT
jgi:putative membrane protein